MGDENKDEEFSSVEELFLLKSCLREGMSQKESRKYVKALSEEVKKNRKVKTNHDRQ